MKKTFKDLLHAALNVLIPPRRTERAIEHLSAEELLAISTLEGPLPYHDPTVTALIWELKYRGNTHASHVAGEFLSELLRAEISESLGKPLLIPMPMHPQRRRERGYNQAELLCESALQHIPHSFEYAPAVLERVRNTAPQQTLARHKRLINLKNAMRAKDPARVAGRICVVVDDVSTTGASFAESRRALLQAGAAEVRAVALARS